MDKIKTEKLNKYLFSEINDFEEVIDRCQELLFSQNEYADYQEIMQVNFDEVGEPSDEEIADYKSYIGKINADLMFGFNPYTYIDLRGQYE